MKKLKQKLIVGLAFGLLLAILLNSTINVLSIAPPISKYTITCSGYVRDKDTGAGINGASVTLSELETGVSKTVTTSPSGYYYVSISTFSYMRYILRASKSGYQTQTKSYYSPGRYSYNFYLYHVLYTMICKGYVRDFNSEGAIVGASVTLTETGTGTSKTVATSASGYYYIYIQTTSYSSYTLRASKSGYQTLTKTYSTPSTYTKNFYLYPPGAYFFTCSGYVTDHNRGTPISGASVTLKETSTGANKVVTTNSQGYYYGKIYATNDYYFQVIVEKDWFYIADYIYSSPGTYTHNFELVPFAEVNIRNIDDYEFIKLGRSIDIVALCTGSFSNVYLQIDSDTPIQMTRYGIYAHFTVTWNTIGMSGGSHTLKVYVTDGGGNIMRIHEKPITITSIYQAHLYYEIDYMWGLAPPTFVLDYWVDYWRDRAIYVEYIVDDCIAYSPLILGIDGYEAAYNDHEFASEGTTDDRGFNVYDSQEKWILWGSTYINPLVFGFCYANSYYGNYILIASQTCVSYELQNIILNCGSQITVLMHETGHSIGILKQDANGDEEYDPDLLSVMSSINIFGVTFYSHWYYSCEYWATRNLSYY